MRDKINRVLQTDSYKTGQWKQMPPNMTSMFSYFESRGSSRKYTEAALFGLQYFLKKYLSTPIEQWEVDEAYEFAQDSAEPFPYEEWTALVQKHGGKLPIRVRAVPEGQLVPLKTPLFTVESTDPEFRWVPDWIETMFCRVGWYGSTVLTQSFYLRELIYSYLVKTADNPDAEIGFKLHDFGARGASSHETSTIGGAAHLAVFRGSDNLEATKLIKDYYHTWKGVRASIPASQHSTITSWGKEHEVDAYRNMLNLYKDNKIFACVSDSWDIYSACSKLWGEELRQEVIDSGALVVIRPDSGDPLKVLFGYSALECDEEHINGEYESEDVYKQNGKYYEIEPFYSYGEHLGYIKGKEIPLTENEIKGVFNILAEKFGTTTNSKGYKVLNHVRVIQGDGVNPDSIAEILEQLTKLGYSTSNIAFGMGGALLQKVDRDTLKFAYKCSSATIDGEERDVYKDPITDGGKTSKKGRLDVIYANGVIETVKLTPSEIERENSIMRTVYEDGVLLVDYTFKEIMERVI